MTTELTTKIWGDIYGVRADWAQASSSVQSLGEDGWRHTGKQVADFQHNDVAALIWVLEEVARVTGDLDDEASAEINKAVDRAKG
jgi:hypothetical protein